MSKKKEEKIYKLLNDEVARPLFKNSPVARELTARVVGEVLKVDYKEIIKNMKLISEDMLFSTKTLDSRTDMMLEMDKYYVNIEFCYTRGNTRQKQMDSYVYEILSQRWDNNCYTNLFKIPTFMINPLFYKEI